MANRSPVLVPVLRGLAMAVTNGDSPQIGTPVKLGQTAGTFTAVITTFNGTDVLTFAMFESSSSAGPWTPCPSTPTAETPTSASGGASITVLQGSHSKPWLRPSMTSDGDGDSSATVTVFEPSIKLQAAP